MSKLSDNLERNIRKAIDDTPGIDDVSELEYVEATLEALESIEFGFDARLEELQEEDDDEE